MRLLRQGLAVSPLFFYLAGRTKAFWLQHSQHILKSSGVRKQNADQSFDDRVQTSRYRSCSKCGPSDTLFIHQWWKTVWREACCKLSAALSRSERDASTRHLAMVRRNGASLYRLRHHRIIHHGPGSARCI